MRSLKDVRSLLQIVGRFSESFLRLFALEAFKPAQSIAVVIYLFDLACAVGFTSQHKVRTSFHCAVQSRFGEIAVMQH